MKKFTWLCLVACLTFVVAFGQPSKNAKAKGPFVVSTADLASMALLRRNMTKECVPVAEMLKLMSLRQAQADLTRLGTGGTYNMMVMSSSGSGGGGGCPCPPQQICHCDTTAYYASMKLATLETWHSNPVLVNIQKMDTLKYMKTETQGGITLLQIAPKVEDGDYKLIIPGTFGGGDPAPVPPYELPTSVRNGKLYFPK